MSGLRLLRLPEGNEEYGWIRSMGFTMARSCGDESQGLLMSLGLSYLEGLILAQGTVSNNFLFIEPMYYRLQETSELPLICDYLTKISQRKADHEQFVINYKNDEQLLREIQEFTNILFNSGNFTTVEEIYNNLTSVSTELNIQISLYSNTNVITVKDNAYIYPLVLSIYYTIKDCRKFHMLYHQNYQKIDIINRNTSEEFFPTKNQVNEITHLQSLCDELVQEFSSLSGNFAESDKQSIKECIEKLKTVTGKGFDYERALKNIIG